ncbi:MAG: hypothetical protein Q8M08_12010 [Bacteroidales bacterium]|nr:hypothetical protein [Bacteroidales bacterium]
MKPWYRFPFWPVILLLLLAMASSCYKDDDPIPDAPSGTVSFTIDHRVNGEPLQLNELKYTNAAGNIYMVNDLMYFISDITFYRNDGSRKVIGAWKEIFYVDEVIPATKTIKFPDKIPTGSYDSISFIFGISEAKNKSFMFVNPPEVIMGWPEVLGGGYHYMMLNGKWKDTTGTVMPFNFHLGIGQLYKGNGYNIDSIYAFVQNYFRVTLPGSSFQMADKGNLTFLLTMNIEKWFESPHVYDHNHWGGAIMQRQPAMQMAKENGWDVFSIEPY